MDSSPTWYYVGWDVSGWHTNGDALCVLREDDFGLQIEGRPWHGNLRTDLCNSESSEVTDAMLGRCGIWSEDSSHLVFAIDTPLGWPRSFIRLITNSETTLVTPDGRCNPYLFRQTERFLAKRRFQPLSPVRDMIGSPSTKGIQFLHAIGLQRSREVGVWEDEHDQPTVTAIETYPAVCRSSETLKEHFSSLSIECAFQDSLTHNERHDKDLEDALYCALVAWLFVTDRGCLWSPENVPMEEGWIWVPQDAEREAVENG